MPEVTPWHGIVAAPRHFWPAFLSRGYFSHDFPSSQSEQAYVRRATYGLLLVLILLSSQSSCVLRSVIGKSDESTPIVPANGYATLAKFPFREAWYGMYFQKEKIGYSHFKILPAGENYKISIDSRMRLTALKKTTEFSSREEVMVRPDLTMVSFRAASHMNGKDLVSHGRVEGGRVILTVAVEGETVRRQYPIPGDVYHTSAVSLMPAVRGLKDGAKYSFGVFSPENQGVEKVQQFVSKVVGEAGPHGAIWKVKNNYGTSHVYSWANNKGLPVLEEGPVLTVLEDESTAREFLGRKGPGKDLVLDFSLIKVSKSLPNPEKLRSLQIEMTGIDSSLIPSDHRQQVSPTGGMSTDVTMLGRVGSYVLQSAIASWAALSREKHDSSGSGERSPKRTAPSPFQVKISSEDLKSLKSKSKTGELPVNPEYLKPTVAIQSGHREIVEQAGKIVAPDDSDLEKLTKLVRWTSKNIESKMKDSFTALSVLRTGEGECQSHANLYTALARSCRIPTRVVTGLVYSEGLGFLYHAWAESYVNGWIAVDPTLDQIPADATHIKVSTGEASTDVRSLLSMVGKVKIKVVEYQ